MVIFLAGVHGVGKTFLGKPVAESLGFKHATASDLIREELGGQSWQDSITYFKKNSVNTGWTFCFAKYLRRYCPSSHEYI